MKKEVVVTGIGAVTPFGIGVDILWNNLLEKNNGISRITDIPVKNEIVSIGGMLPAAELGSDDYGKEPEDQDIKIYFEAVKEAIEGAGLEEATIGQNERAGVFVADRVLGTAAYLEEYIPIFNKAMEEDSKEINIKRLYEQLKEHPVGRQEFDTWEGVNQYIARAYSIVGPQISYSTACASGNTSIGEALRKIRSGKIDIAITGGAYNYDLATMIGFTNLGALTKVPDPDKACRPFDASRSGFVMGSGCGILILEEREHAKKREAKILAKVSGYGYSTDAFRATDPDPKAAGAVRAIKNCIEDGGIHPKDIAYVNAHGTSTKMNDYMETKAIKEVFMEHAEQLKISSTKSMIGHSIMAAAAIEAVVCVKSLMHQKVHPTRNYEIQDEDMELDYVANTAQNLEIDHIISNSFGFGGQNTCVMFSKYEPESGGNLQ